MFHTNIYQPQHIEVKESSLHGRGVFAKNRITKGSLNRTGARYFLIER